MLCDARMNFKQPEKKLRVKNFADLKVGFFTIFEVRIIERDPKADGRGWFGVQVRSILMTRHFASHAWVFVNVHALSHGRSLEAQLPAQLPDPVVERVFAKDGVFHSQSVPDFVQRKLLGHQKLVVAVDGARLEEVANLIAGFDEISFAALKICFEL